MANYNELKVRARVIQNETQNGQNTANRVGSLFYDIIAALADIDGGGGGGSTVPNITAAATVNNSTGTPYVNVVKGGTDAAPRFTFNFGNLKGATGAAGATGPQGPQGIQGPQGAKGDPGEGIDAETIQHIEDLEKDLEDLMDNLDTEMEEKVKDLFKDTEFLKELFPDGSGGYSNFGQALNDYTDKYLQIIGMWEEDPTTHQKVYKWSKIQQEYNQIQSRVATLETVAGFPDSYKALVADLIQSIKDDEAFAELMTGYATVQDVNNVKTVVEWLYSGLRNSTTPDRTISEIVSAGKSALGGAIADVRTYVEKLKSGDYVAKASLAAALTDNNNQVLSDAGVLFTAGLDNSLGTFFAKSSGNTASISALANKLGSVIQISADQIVLSGTTFAQDILANGFGVHASGSTYEGCCTTEDGIHVGSWVWNNGTIEPLRAQGYDYCTITPDGITSEVWDKSTRYFSLTRDEGLTFMQQVSGTPTNMLTMDYSGIYSSNPDGLQIYGTKLVIDNTSVDMRSALSVTGPTELSASLLVKGNTRLNACEIDGTITVKRSSTDTSYNGYNGSFTTPSGDTVVVVNGVVVDVTSN